MFALLSLRGTLRVLLVLLHDFPEFLCDYHCGFCDVIPPNCIQVSQFSRPLLWTQNKTPSLS